MKVKLRPITAVKKVYELGNAEFADGKVKMGPQSFVMIEL